MVTPPVGMKRTDRNGAASALTMAAPPSCSAGKNLTVSSPASSAIMISVAEATPGKTGTPSSWQRATTAGPNPGLTTNRAPASTARSTWSRVSTVPAPTSISGRLARV